MSIYLSVNLFVCMSSFSILQSVLSIEKKIIDFSFENGRGANDNFVDPGHQGKDGTVRYNSRGYLGRGQVSGQLVA